MKRFDTIVKRYYIDAYYLIRKVNEMKLGDRIP